MMKQRLIGSLVLLALGMVFWPIIFVQPPPTQTTMLPLSSPTPPIIDTSPMPIPADRRADIESTLYAPEADGEAQAAADAATLIELAAPETTASAAEQSQTKPPAARFESEVELDAETALVGLPSAVALDPAKARESAPEAVELDTGGYAKSWVLQVATLSSERRATGLVQTLKAKGYEAFTRRASGARGDLWRVQIGPKLERAKLTAIKTEIDRSLKVESAILRYLP